MRGKKQNPEKIIPLLREIEINTGAGMSVKEACKQAGVVDVTYYKWRKQFGGMNIQEAKKYKELERENARLKKLVADLSLDNAALREISSGNF